MKFWSRAVMAAAVFGFALSTVAAYAVTTPQPPTAPRNLKATAGDSQVDLTWTAPSSGGPIIQYRVITSPGDTRTGTTSTSIAMTGLNNGTTYSFAVQALNAIGYGPAARITATPHVIPPSAPTNLAATSGPTAGEMTLSWTPPNSNGSAPNIAYYTITVNPGNTTARTPDGQTTTYVASNIADNVTYTFKVTATNSKGATGPAATVYAPLPLGANIGLQPTAGGPTTAITVTGEQFLKNESLTLYWDVSSHVATSIVTDGNGSFTKVIKPFAGDKPKVHKLCTSVQPHPCATFSLQGLPTPTPGVTPSPADTSTPSATDTPQASGVRPAGSGGISGLDIITRPPFVFLPIIAIVGILGMLAYWWLSRRRSMPPGASATVVHRATRPDYMAPFPTAGSTPPAPRNPAQPSAWDAPVQPYAPPPAQPPTWDAPGQAAQPYVPPAQPYVPPAAQPPSPAAAPPAAAPPAPPAPPPPAPAPPPRSVEWPAPPNPPAAPDEPPDLPQPSD